MSDIYNQMLERYDLSTDAKRRNAIFEVNQQIILSGLYTGGFFDNAAFYGGTCLRIFHGLDRFSEDMDFSLIKEDETFSFSHYFDPIVKQFSMMGREVEIYQKDKKTFGKIESAFLKDNTEIYNIVFQTEKSIKIKIEVDICPPQHFSTEQRLSLLPFSFMTRCFVLPDLFAGKMHAMAFRLWKQRVKGRDWYDFEWYVRKGIVLNYTHLQERIRQFNGVLMPSSDFIELLRNRISNTPIKQVKEDVLPFIRDPHSIDIWSTDYFLSLVDMIHFKNN